MQRSCLWRAERSFLLLRQGQNIASSAIAPGRSTCSRIRRLHLQASIAMPASSEHTEGPRNNLASSSSPYLQQHATNPVCSSHVQQQLLLYTLSLSCWTLLSQQKGLESHGVTFEGGLVSLGRGGLRESPQRGQAHLPLCRLQHLPLVTQCTTCHIKVHYLCEHSSLSALCWPAHVSSERRLSQGRQSECDSPVGGAHRAGHDEAQVACEICAVYACCCIAGAM